MNSLHKRVVITGAAGFIGSHCANAFAREGFTVIGVDRLAAERSVHPRLNCHHFENDDLSSVAGMEALLKRRRPEILVHAAGPASVERSFLEPRADLLDQVLPWATVLEAIRLNSPDTRVVLCSSAAAYGNPFNLPVNERAPARPISPYGWHKIMKEQLLREYVELHGIRGSVARIFSTFGPGLRQLAVWDIARRVLKNVLTLEGTGRETRDYLYIHDVARAIKDIALLAPGEGEVINVASGTETKISTLAQLISAHFGKLEVRFETDQKPMAGKPVRWRADVTKLASFGFVPASTLQSGLATTLDWIKNQK